MRKITFIGAGLQPIHVGELPDQLALLVDPMADAKFVQKEALFLHDNQ